MNNVAPCQLTDLISKQSLILLYEGYEFVDFNNTIMCGTNFYDGANFIKLVNFQL